MTEARAYAKINLSLVVGPVRPGGKHEVATVLQRVDLCDLVRLEPGEPDTIVVEGFDDTLVRDALSAYSALTGTAPAWRASIEKRIPVASGLGGGSSDAAAALLLANALAAEPLAPEGLHAVARQVGADVPFFLRSGPQLATGDGTDLEPVSLPLDYWVVLALPDGVEKVSTAAVYDRFDDRHGADGFEGRRAALLAALAHASGAADLAQLPRNDLAVSPLTSMLTELGAFRADVSGAGPAVYGLFEQEQSAESAGRALGEGARTWLLRPVTGT